MSYVDVTLPEPDPDEEGATFVRFEAPGDQFAGVFLEKIETDGNYGKKRMNYRFKTEDGVKICTPTTRLQKLFEATNGGAGLKRGDKVIVEYTHDFKFNRNDRQGNPMQPMKMYSLKHKPAGSTQQARAPQGQGQQQRRPQQQQTQQRPPPQRQAAQPPADDDFDDVPL